MTFRLLERVSTRLFDTPLLITPEYGSVITTVLADRVGVQPLVSAEMVESYKRPNARAQYDARTGITTVPIVGALVHRGDGPEAASGVEGYTSIHNRLSALFGDDKTRGILLDIDSSGGEAAGLSELAAWIPKASKQAGKPVWVIANSVMGSAAYWLGSTGARVFAAPNASRVGSIGVFVQHIDMSKAVERKGLVVSFVYAGDHKIDGHPFGPLPDDVRADMQSRVDRLYTDFVEAVAENRGLDPKKIRATQARVYGPDEAKEVGLVSGVAGLGTVLNAFAEHLNQPRVGYIRDGAAMAEELVYSQADLDGAKASMSATVNELNGKLAAAAEDRKALLTAFAELAPENPKVAIFVEALNEGGSVALASKMAAKIEAPKAAPAAPETEPRTRTDADVDALMRAHAPGVKDNGSEPSNDPKAARMAELQGSMKAFNASRGFVAK